ncbi:MAG: hypothetical protein KDD10_14925 [Phaeodactylibacter sp.]|nr:hypothetical protein [Phaeodactylibacter sp.]MCB9296212.1 hypothetical protein [Lewinellaceae bacterium]
MKGIPGIRISARFCGPPGTANGGYACGRLDNLTDYVSEVTLRRPPPLDKELEVQREGDELRLMDGDQLVASARPGAVAFAAPAPPEWEQAEEASRRFIGFRRHPFPGCFVCGPDRGDHDGLHIFAGRVGEAPLFASPWIPEAELADAARRVRNEFLWAALDCPGAFAVCGEAMRKVVLGRMTARIEREIRAGERCTVLAWPKGQDGRKFFSGTAIYNAGRQLCAVGDAVWIEIA